MPEQSTGTLRSTRTLRADRQHLPRSHSRSRSRPRIAFFSPFPPRKSGISDYSAPLIRALQPTYTIDLYHEPGYVPELVLSGDGFACCDAAAVSQPRGPSYHALVYQMGNSRYHNFMYETMLRYPGVVTLHDFCLAGFYLIYRASQGRERASFRAELLRWYPDEAAAISELLDAGAMEWDPMRPRPPSGDGH